jgi:spoIIIJ-associated protein
MAAQERTIESSGADVEKAIVSGLKELGLERSDVDVEILDSGSSGFLGIGGREAAVKLTARPETAGIEKASDPSAEEDRQTVTAKERDRVMEEETAADGLLEDTDEDGADGRGEEEVALEIIENLLDRLKFDVSTSVHQTEPDDLTGERRWVIEITGQDLGMLIGNRGETLNALQHIARMMAGHRMRQRPKFIIDVQGYRSRREQALARLAERMAAKVVDGGNPMTLEPMPPNERRIIHLTLRDDNRVYTESFGDGRQRKVRIYPAD